MSILQYFGKHHLELLGLLIAYFGLIIPIYKYLNSKRADEKEKRFKNFHELIKQLVQPEKEVGVTYLDRQVAIVFELTNLTEYYPVSSRILSGLKMDWCKLPNNENYQRLISEMDLTIIHIENYQNTWFRKLANTIKNKLF